MRILHTSDWHLGRDFHRVQLLDMQFRVLGSIAEMVRTESIDVVVIAGDIYDRALPSVDAVRAFSDLVTEIWQAGAQVVAISGNHDSAVRVSSLSPVLSAAGVTIAGDVQAAGVPVVIGDPSGSFGVAFYPIPYLEPESARYELCVPELRSHSSLLSHALSLSLNDLGRRNDVRSVAIAHAFVTGGEGSESERALSVGGSAEVPLRSLKGFDYVALGHLHGRQKLGGGRARYSGSPLAYSFSEANHTKGVWIIDLPETGEVSVSALDLPVERGLARINGSISDLMSDPTLSSVESKFVQATVTDVTLPLDVMAHLRRRFPYALEMVHRPPARLSRAASYGERIHGRGDIELINDFIEHVSGRIPTRAEQRDLHLALDELYAVEGEHDSAERESLTSDSSEHGRSAA